MLASKLPFDHRYAAGYSACTGYQSVPTDPDAVDYLNRVAAADGAAVEVGVAMAVDQFVKGCKADGIWDAIKSACIMCGARTLSGALVSLRQYGPEMWDNGASPTVVDNYGSSGSYDIAARTMSNLAVSTNNSYPRFQFNTIGVTIGITYAVSGQLTGDLSSLNNIRFGPGSTLTFDQSTGVISGTATASQAFLEFLIDGTVAPSSVRIESLSIKEVINDATNVANNFASGDYSRTTGLKGDGATKYLDSNRAADADGDNDHHVSAYMTQGSVVSGEYLIGAMTTASSYTIAGFSVYSRSPTVTANLAAGTGLYGVSRDNASDFVYIKASGGVLQSDSRPTVAANISNNHSVFAYTRNDGVPIGFTDSRLAFYSIGSALDLAALDTRVTNLINGIKFHSLTGLVATDYDPDTVAYIVSAYEAGGTL